MITRCQAINIYINIDAHGHIVVFNFKVTEMQFNSIFPAFGFAQEISNYHNASSQPTNQPSSGIIQGINLMEKKSLQRTIAVLQVTRIPTKDCWGRRDLGSSKAEGFFGEVVHKRRVYP